MFEYAINNMNMLLKSCDAIVVSKTGDHKYIFLKTNMPEDIIEDEKGRKAGTEYIKNGRKIYNVVVDMYELPTVKSGDGDYADIWVVDDLKQAQHQLDIIIRAGAKQFLPKVVKKK
jgi:hypothetical protein